MRDPIAEAVIEAAEHGAPPKTWQVPETTEVEYGTNPYDPFDGATFTHWSVD